MAFDQRVEGREREEPLTEFKAVLAYYKSNMFLEIKINECTQ